MADIACSHIDRKPDDFDVIYEFDWGDFVVEDKMTQARFPLLAEVSDSTIPRSSDRARFNGYCRQYAFRDTYKSRMRLFEITSSQPSGRSYYHSKIFGDDIAVDQIIDEEWGDVDEIFEKAKTDGVATRLHYRYIATPNPGQRKKNLAGCNMFKVDNYLYCHKLFNPDFEKMVNREVCRQGPVFATFGCLEDYGDIAKDFIYLPRTRKSFKSFAHALMITGFGRAKIKSTNYIVDYSIGRNNWGTNKGRVICRIPTLELGQIYAPKFTGQIDMEPIVNARVGESETHRIIHRELLQ